MKERPGAGGKNSAKKPGVEGRGVYTKKKGKGKTPERRKARDRAKKQRWLQRKKFRQ